MTRERKVDLTKVWSDVPSADVVETRRAQQRAAATPLVSIGHVQGNVITINTAAGLDLAGLLQSAGRPEGGAS